MNECNAIKRMNPSPLAFFNDVVFQCTLCYYQTFDQPAGRLTRVLLCGRRTEQEPHTLCHQCFCNISGNGTRSFRCPMCRSVCYPRDVPQTGDLDVNVCSSCNGLWTSLDQECTSAPHTRMFVWLALFGQTTKTGSPCAKSYKSTHMQAPMT